MTTLREHLNQMKAEIASFCVESTMGCYHLLTPAHANRIRTLLDDIQREQQKPGDKQR